MVKDETLAKLLPPLGSLEFRIVIFKIGVIIATLQDFDLILSEFLLIGLLITLPIPFSLSFHIYPDRKGYSLALGSHGIQRNATLVPSHHETAQENELFNNTSEREHEFPMPLGFFSPPTERWNEGLLVLLWAPYFLFRLRQPMVLDELNSPSSSGPRPLALRALGIWRQGQEHSRIPQNGGPYYTGRAFLLPSVPHLSCTITHSA